MGSLNVLALTGGASSLKFGVYRNRTAGKSRSPIKPISASTSRCQVLVPASQEDEQIARQAWALRA